MDINSKSKEGLSVIIPVYNSRDTLQELVSRINRTMTDAEMDFEIIMVDDGSTDDSWQILQSLFNKYRNITIIKLLRNFGQHNGLLCGFKEARFNKLITIDDDLQNRPEEIPKMLQKMQEHNFDVVYSEYSSKRHAPWRNLGSNIVQAIYKKIFKVKKNCSSFRLLNSTIAELASQYDKKFVFLDGLIATYTNSIGYVETSHQQRKHGQSGYSFRKLITLSLNLLTNFSIFPLQVASFLGFTFSVVGFCLAIFYLIRKIFFYIGIPGYASLITAIAIFSGVQLITLGLIGEYIARIHININNYKQYVIHEKKEHDTDEG